MAKKKGASLHSRAARRATSPSIDTDKSLKDITPPSRTTTVRPSVLAAQHAAGISKKTSKRGRKSQMSAKARRRHEKGLEMAEAVMGRTSRKVEKSLGRGRLVKDRSRAWEEVNRVADGEMAAGRREEGRESEGNGGWETDEEMDGAAEDAVTMPAPVSAPAATEIPLPIDDDEDIL